MHSLVGCFAIDEPIQEVFNEVSYFKIEIKLSNQFKRVFYLLEFNEKKQWLARLRLAMH